MEKAAALLNNHQRIVILAGIGCRGAEDKVYRIAEILNAPIIHALRAKELFPESHPYSIGGLGNLGIKPAVEALESAELILMLGTDFPYFEYLPARIKTIQIDINPRQIGKRLPVEVGIWGDAGEMLERLLLKIQNKKSSDFLKTAQKHMQDWQREMHSDIESKAKPIKPQRLAYQIGEAADSDAIFVCDTGEVTAWNARYLQIKPGQKFTVSGSLASMAFGLPAAIGAKLTYPGRQVIALLGDGGFSMLMTDFSTAVRYKLPIIFVIFNNHRLGMIQIEQESRGLPNYQTENHNPDFAEFAKICGGNGITVNDPGELENAINQAISSPVPFILNVHIDPDEIPVPPKITAKQALSYGAAKIKELAGF